MPKEGAAVLGILFVTLVIFNHMRIGFLREEYEEWERKYDSDELIRSMRFDHSVDRFSIWLRSRQFVKSHQAKSYSVELNRFAHLTDDEYHVFASNLRSESVEWPHFACQIFNHNNQFISDTENFDWRNSAKVTPVRNQAQCGSCWAFAATAALESARAIKENVLEHLSPQQMVDCAVGEWGKSEYPNHGCNGGLPESAFTYSNRVINHKL
jgi:cathepsin L